MRRSCSGGPAQIRAAAAGGLQSQEREPSQLRRQPAPCRGSFLARGMYASNTRERAPVATMGTRYRADRSLDEMRSPARRDSPPNPPNFVSLIG